MMYVLFLLFHSPVAANSDFKHIGTALAILLKTLDNRAS
jgi:hypothetical protein